MTDIEIGKIYVNKDGGKRYVHDIDNEGYVWLVRPGDDGKSCIDRTHFLEEYTLKQDPTTDQDCYHYGYKAAMDKQNKVVKEFVEMMDHDYNRVNRPKVGTSYPFDCQEVVKFMHPLMISPEYQALKALVEECGCSSELTEGGMRVSLCERHSKEIAQAPPQLADFARQVKPKEEKKMKYTTVEGHEVVRDGEYETRDGSKAVALGFDSSQVTSIAGHIIVGDIPSHKDRILQWWFTSGIADSELDGCDLMRPWKEEKKEEEKKRYELKDMWKVWMRTCWGELGNQVYFTRKGAKDFSIKCCHEVLAITPADQQYFMEGEGLDK